MGKRVPPAVLSSDPSAASYMEKAAAHVGSKTEHGPSIPTGSPNVNINGKPAWRAELDVVSCDGPPVLLVPMPAGIPIPVLPVPTGMAHGPEVVVVGSSNVRINGHDAVRRHDVAVGSGGPNPITEGSPNVHFGENGWMGGYGMDDDDMAAEYCKKLCELVKAWPGMTPDERKAALEDFVHWSQDHAGLPRSSIAYHDGDPQFVDEDWKLYLPRTVPSNGQNVPLFDLPKIESTTFGGNAYHETRHGEQYFMALRYRVAQDGLADTPANVDRLARETGIPRHVVEQAFKAPRYEVGSHEYRYAKLMHASLLGRGGFNPEYWRRAHERDARMVGYRGDCHGCC